MAVFLTAYDLHKQEQNYEAVDSLLESWNAKRVLRTTWLVSGDLSDEKILTAMKEGPLDANDSIVVAELKTCVGSNLLTKIPGLEP